MTRFSNLTRALEGKAIVVVDEAYIEFSGGAEPRAPDPGAAAPGHPADPVQGLCPGGRTLRHLDRGPRGRHAAAEGHSAVCDPAALDGSRAEGTRTGSNRGFQGAAGLNSLRARAAAGGPAGSFPTSHASGRAHSNFVLVEFADATLALARVARRTTVDPGCAWLPGTGRLPAHHHRLAGAEHTGCWRALR